MSMRRYIWPTCVSWGLLVLAVASGCGDETIAPPSSILSIQQAATNSGDGQTGTAGTTLANPLRVLVRRGTEPAPGVAVSWQTSQGFVSARSTTTDGSGIAAVMWTVDTLAGGQRADAALLGLPDVPDTLALRVSFTAFANPGPASQLRFSVPPSNAFAGRPLLPAVQLSEFDRFGNLVTAFTGTVTIALDPSPNGGSLSGTTTVAALGGVAKFGDLSIDHVGTGYTLSASVAGLSGATSSAFDVVSPGLGRVAFWSDRDGNAEIYTMNADGASVARLTNDTASDHGPAWSPDGTKIAFNRGTQIYVMNADGSGVTALTAGSDPAWSHSGTRIAGSRVTVSPPPCHTPVGPCRVTRIFVINADGSGLVTLLSGFTPTWSPGGTIAFANGSEIFVMNADGSGLTNLTNNPAPDDGPAWSPDGTKIAFRSNRTGAYDLYVMNADGSGIRALTRDAATEGRPSWSSDGTRNHVRERPRR